MNIRRLIPALTLAAGLGLGQAALAQEDAGPTLADLGQDQALTAAFEKMAAGHEVPAWIREGMVTTPSQKVSFGGKDYLAMTGCKQHDCAANQVAMLYAPDSDKAYGVLSVHDGKGAELLTWLNIGGDAESIDGRTILYAALTGSLANHPEAFDYPAE
ncbi:Ivy family c-type lysozyme inhibitor [Paracoccus sp. TOH]|uniref:Ivy family c-type lysozyme inhibitor n=1 Tax=Paracoccus simplex TaxID=2086346 RepID=A0ABV7S2Q9_9RHOB|nr:Ivy family c-type lysozyme inhibitor [Paracoccus sp. TOH]WJS84003.1 Ivy family c-type lysozyme inhibitor [Paracoccus sp. TOH]